MGDERPSLEKRLVETAGHDEEFEELFEKERRYISDPSEAPEGVEVQEGEQGGLYYETTGGGSESGGEPSGGEGLDEVTIDDVDPITIESLAENVAYDALEYGYDPDAAAERFWQAVDHGEDLAEAYAANTEGTSPESMREIMAEEFDVPYNVSEEPEEGESTEEIADYIRDYLDVHIDEDTSRGAVEDMVEEYITGHGENPEDYGGVEAVTDAVLGEEGGEARAPPLDDESIESREDLEDMEYEYQEMLDEATPEGATMGSVLLPDEGLPEEHYEAFHDIMTSGDPDMIEGLQEAIHQGSYDTRYDGYDDIIDDIELYAEMA